MPKPLITLILRDHGVTVIERGERLYAWDRVVGPGNTDSSEWVNVTGWKLARLKAWLGY
jgi:hypothetical protein